ncbi:MAG: alpha-glucosidase [bacterium]|nr:alpha-glucosidase [bacterium]
MDNEWVWWKHGVVYQIYPRSFYDSNKDGIGDIPGIIEKLDYLSDLGVDAIWLSPINKSPMYDFGYDISDYYAVDEIFGTSEDFSRLIALAHERDIKIIMDLVINHTSYLHPWFLESRCSRENPKRDWYIWRDGKGKKPPNNWLSSFGGGAWTYDELTSQYYFHSCLEEQPDVNWRNAELKKALFSVMEYWFTNGVDGFRLDIVNWFTKDRRFSNNPRRMGLHLLQKHKFDRNRPENHTLMKELRSLTDTYDERMLVGEVFSLPPGNPALAAGYLGNGTDELHLAFDFSLIYRTWNARLFYRSLKRWMSRIPEKGWPCHVLSNHDQPRSLTRYGLGGDGYKRAKVAATLLLTLKGTPFIYYGEEIGMKNSSPKRDEICDPLGKKYWPLFPGRDPARTPMQWSYEKNAGFSCGECKMWLPVGSDYLKNNVQSETGDSTSLLNHYRDLIKIRKQYNALHRGEWIPVLKGRNGLLGYYRVYEHKKSFEKFFIILNFTAKNKKVRINDRAQWQVVHSTHRSPFTHFTTLHFSLSPYEAMVIKRIGSLRPPVT